MITKVEVYRDGHREVYHRTDGGQKAWTHPATAPCDVCHKPAVRRVSCEMVSEASRRGEGSASEAA